MEGRSSILLPLVAATLLSGLAAYVGWSLGSATGAPEAEPESGAAATILTDFRLPSLDGGEIGPADYAGEVVVVDFWATWCSPCRIQARILESLYEEFEGRDVNFLAVSLGEEEEKVRSFSEATPFAYPVLYDTADMIATEAEIYALPTVMIVDRSGRVSYMKAGLSDEPTLREALESAVL